MMPPLPAALRKTTPAPVATDSSKPYWTTMDGETVKLHLGNVTDVLALLPRSSVHCVVTSPPYWGLRDYGGDKSIEIGSEPSPDCGTNGEAQCGGCFVCSMVAVFRAVRRVLRDDGTLWLNLGDTYSKGINGGVNPINAAWLASLIDGEGCIRIAAVKRPNRAPMFQSRISVLMKDEQMCRRAFDITGLGVLKFNEPRQMWAWHVRAQMAANVLKSIYPYLLIKRRQAAAAIELQRDIEAGGHRFGKSVPAETIAIRQSLMDACASCNQRSDNGLILPEPLAPKDHGETIPIGNRVGIPWRVALALQHDGWTLRQDICWSKPNPMPESVRNRCTTSFEYVFLLTKSMRYYYDAEAIKEKSVSDSHEFNGSTTEKSGANGDRQDGGRAAVGNKTVTSNKRSVWTVSSQGYPGAHFATFPSKLIEPMILAGTSEKGCCSGCGAPWKRVVEETPLKRKRETVLSERQLASRNGERGGKVATTPNDVAGVEVKTVGWEPTCECNGRFEKVKVKKLVGSPRKTGRKDGDGDEFIDADVRSRDGKSWAAWQAAEHDDEDFKEVNGVRYVSDLALEDHQITPCVVLDPFIGSGTTCCVSLENGRNSIGIDLSERYLKNNAVPRIEGALLEVGRADLIRREVKVVKLGGGGSGGDGKLNGRAAGRGL